RTSRVSHRMSGASLTARAVLALAAAAASSPAGANAEPPAASFLWFPAAPLTGEPVSLASTSTDATSPIAAWAWDLAGNGTFQQGSSVITTTFSAPGRHVVRLVVIAMDGS